ncbi:MAG TPA: response regulator [Kofleriaceae bacterium]|nr:response regulator [Kofleriaceae bacterium]
MHRLPEKHRAWLETDVAQLLRELKAPLARIAADASALLGSRGSSTPNAQALYRIDHSIMILERSIEQLMEINAIESGALAMDLRAVDLGALIDSVISSYPESERITHRLDRRITVMADERRLGFGIASLLYAALSCLPRTSRVAVQTTGEGFRARVSVTASGSGNDHPLGLFIARRIAQIHGGTASMRERAGMTSFYMELPVAVARAHKTRRQGSSSILLVDDNIEQVTALAELLRDDGLAIDYATSGREALERIARSMPDVLIVDIQIPDMDGTEVIRRARERRPDLPAVLLTGYPPEHPLVVSALATTGSTYVPKPVNLHELLEVVEDALRS